MAKSTDAETQKRVTAIYSMLLEGSSRAEIIQYGAKEWHVSDRMIDTYLARAREAFIEKEEADRDYQFNKSLSRYNQLYAKAFAEKDYKMCLQLQQRIDRLFGLEAPAKQELSGFDGAPLTIRVINGNDYE
jgi:hypothetical protein